MCTTIVSIFLAVLVPGSLHAEPVAPGGATGEEAASTDTAGVREHWEVQVVHLAHADPEAVCKLLLNTVNPRRRSLFQAQVGVTAGTIVLAGHESALQQACELIKSLDVEPADELLSRVFKLNAAYAKDTAAQIEYSLAGAFHQEDPARRPRIQGIGGFNGLLVTAASRDMQRIAQLVEALDVPVVKEWLSPERTFVEGVIYEVRMTPDAVVSLDADALTSKAQSVQSLHAALAEMGQTRVLHRVHQRVELDAKPTLRHRASVPFVRAKTAGDKGEPTVHQVEYEDVGWTLTLSGRWEDEPKERCMVSVQSELSHQSDSSIELGAGIQAPIFHKLQQSFDGDVASGQPILLIAIQSPEGQPAEAFITRLVLERQE